MTKVDYEKKYIGILITIEGGCWTKSEFWSKLEDFNLKPSFIDY